MDKPIKICVYDGYVYIVSVDVRPIIMAIGEFEKLTGVDINE